MKQKFNWEQFLDTDNKVAVHCETEEEAKTFCKLMHEHRLKWRGDELYTERTNWSHYKSETCYESDGCYCCVEWFVNNNYKVLEFENYDFGDEPPKENEEPAKKTIQDLLNELIDDFCEFCKYEKECDIAEKDGKRLPCPIDKIC